MNQDAGTRTIDAGALKRSGSTALSASSASTTPLQSAGMVTWRLTADTEGRFTGTGVPRGAVVGGEAATVLVGLTGATLSRAPAGMRFSV